MGKERVVYRKWEHDGIIHYIKVFPDNMVFEIVLRDDLFGSSISINRTKNLHGITADLLRKHKSPCLKQEFIQAIDLAKKSLSVG